MNKTGENATKNYFYATKEQGEEIKKYLKSRLLTQEDVANILRVSQSTITSLINGKRKFTNATALLWEKELGISSVWLIDGTGDISRTTGDVSVSDRAQFAQGDINNAGDTNAGALADALEIIKEQQKQIDKLIKALTDASNTK